MNESKKRKKEKKEEKERKNEKFGKWNREEEVEISKQKLKLLDNLT